MPRRPGAGLQGARIQPGAGLLLLSRGSAGSLMAGTAARRGIAPGGKDSDSFHALCLLVVWTKKTAAFCVPKFVPFAVKRLRMNGAIPLVE